MTRRELRGRVPGGTIAPRFGPEGSFVARRSWRNGGVIVVAACLLDGRSRVLRTLASKPQNGDYRYVVQPGDLFVLWLDQPKVRAVRNIVPFIKVKDPEHIPYLYLDRRPRGL